MKIPSLAIGVALLMFQCSSKKTDSAAPAETVAAAPVQGTVFALDTAASQITWKGGTPTGHDHHGILKFKSGTLSADQQVLTSAQLVADMNSIQNLDETGQGRIDLEGHLKNGDFFEVEKYPTGEFKLAKAEAITDSAGYNYRITGALTLKGSARSITFRARVNTEGQTLTAESETFKIDRTQWNIVYHSGVIGTLKDELINDDIILSISLKATAPAQ